MASDDRITKMTPEEILAFQPTKEEQQRADELTARNKEGKLTSEEAAELEQMLKFNLFIARLKAKSFKSKR